MALWRETKGRDASSVRRDPSRSEADQGLKATKGYSVELERGNLAVAERILELLAENGPMRPSAFAAASISIAITFPRCRRRASLLEPIPIIRSRRSRGIA